VRPSWLLATAAAALALVAAGCRSRSEPPPPAGAPSARLLVTAGFGAETLLGRRVAATGSIMSALRGAVRVRTAYAGDFVASMLDRSSDLGAQRDWFWFVNGVVGDTGARQHRVRPGDVVWWDYRDWGGQMDVAAVVGSWPEPFVHGYDAAPRAVAADPPLAGILRAAGVRLTTGAAPWRARVGADADLRRRDPAWRAAEADPGRAGLTAAIEHGTVTALGPDGAGRRPVPGGRAVAAAVRTGAASRDGVLLAVAGLDGPAARAAAARIARDPAVLRDRYAVVFDGAGRPLVAAGRRGP
jgi:Domain of unknown function (DUF4430)